MKRLIKLASLAVLCLCFSTVAHAQTVSFKLIYNATASRYEVFMNSMLAYLGSLAQILSSQVTLVVPHGIGASQPRVHQPQV